MLDIPGCFSAGDTLDEALRNVQEAVEVHLYDEELAPEPAMVLGTVLPHSPAALRRRG